MPHKIILGLILCLVLFTAGRAEAKFTVGAGFLYVFQDGNSDANLDPGPGVHVDVGFEGKIFGVRADVFYAAMEYQDLFHQNPYDNDTNIYGGTLDFKVRPIGMIDFPLQPYAVVGIGGQGGVLTGGLGNVGLGLEMAFGEHFSIGAEGNWKPLVYPGHDFFEDPNYGGGDVREMNFFTASLNAAFHF